MLEFYDSNKIILKKWMVREAGFEPADSYESGSLIRMTPYFHSILSPPPLTGLAMPFPAHEPIPGELVEAGVKGPLLPLEGTVRVLPHRLHDLVTVHGLPPEKGQYDEREGAFE